MLLLFKYDILLILLRCCFDVEAWKTLHTITALILSLSLCYYKTSYYDGGIFTFIGQFIMLGIYRFIYDWLKVAGLVAIAFIGAAIFGRDRQHTN
jgi:hypothetical protein